MATVADLITGSFQRLGLVGAGEVLSAEDLAIGFSRFNDFVDSCATERLLIYTRTRTTWTIGSGTQNYTLGSGATINVARPANATDLDFAFQDTSLSPVQEVRLLPLTDAAWAAIPQKSQTNSYPIAAFYNPTFTGAGFGTVSLWMVPTSSTLQGVLYAPQQVAQFATTADPVLLPPGYARFFRDNLALEIAPDYPEVAKVSPELQHSAEQSRENVKRVNVRMSDLSVDAGALIGVQPYGNFYTGIG